MTAASGRRGSAALTSDLWPPPGGAHPGRTAITDPLHFRSARDLAGLIRRRELSAREVVEAHLEQIARVNPRVNAICTLVPEQALADADAADAALAAGRPPARCTGCPS